MQKYFYLVNVHNLVDEPVVIKMVNYLYQLVLKGIASVKRLVGLNGRPPVTPTTTSVPAPTETNEMDRELDPISKCKRALEKDDCQQLEQLLDEPHIRGMILDPEHKLLQLAIEQEKLAFAFVLLRADAFKPYPKQEKYNMLMLAKKHEALFLWLLEDDALRRHLRSTPLFIPRLMLEKLSLKLAKALFQDYHKPYQSLLPSESSERATVLYALSKMEDKSLFDWIRKSPEYPRVFQQSFIKVYEKLVLDEDVETLERLSENFVINRHIHPILSELTPLVIEKDHRGLFKHHFNLLENTLNEEYLNKYPLRVLGFCQRACVNNKPALVDMFLEYPQIRNVLSVNNNQILKRTAYHGHPKIVIKLLQVPAVREAYCLEQRSLGNNVHELEGEALTNELLLSLADEYPKLRASMGHFYDSREKERYPEALVRQLVRNAKIDQAVSASDYRLFSRLNLKHKTLAILNLVKHTEIFKSLLNDPGLLEHIKTTPLFLSQVLQREPSEALIEYLCFTKGLLPKTKEGLKNFIHMGLLKGSNKLFARMFQNEEIVAFYKNNPMGFINSVISEDNVYAFQVYLSQVDATDRRLIDKISKSLLCTSNPHFLQAFFGQYHVWSQYNGWLIEGMLKEACVKNQSAYINTCLTELFGRIDRHKETTRMIGGFTYRPYDKDFYDSYFRKLLEENAYYGRLESCLTLLKHERSRFEYKELLQANDGVDISTIGEDELSERARQACRRLATQHPALKAAIVNKQKTIDTNNHGIIAMAKSGLPPEVIDCVGPYLPGFYADGREFNADGHCSYSRMANIGYRIGVRQNENSNQQDEHGIKKQKANLVKKSSPLKA